MTSQPVIEPGFLFSQHSLNTFARCRRRFLLRYVDRQPWPVLEHEEPQVYEQHLARGRQFHQWIERDHVSLDMEAIVRACDDRDLVRWWGAYKGFDWGALPDGVREAELSTIVPLGEYRLYARFDLLAADATGEAVIVDWKTLERRPTMRTLRERIQTRVYLYAALTAGRSLTGGTALDPERSSMLYWFANYPSDTAEIRYSARAYEEDAAHLASLVQGIAGLPREEFTATADERLCVRCNYRTLCGVDRLAAPDADRGADDPWLEESIDFAVELDEVAELLY